MPLGSLLQTITCAPIWTRSMETDARHVEAVKRHSPLGALLSRTLPAYSGLYACGVMDVELELDQPLSFGNFRHRKMPDNPTGLQIETVFFSLFYPSAVAAPGVRPARAAWFPRFGQTVDGFLRMASWTPNNWWRAIAWPTAAIAVSGLTFPCSANAPILPHPNGKKWPIILFSHGVGCSRLMYSAYCGELASRGYIVVALEHRDGTGPSTTIVSRDGTSKIVNFLQWSDLEWPELSQQPTNDTTLRHVQIQVRLAELDAAIKSLEKMDSGKCPACNNTPDHDFSSFVGQVDTTNPVMTGHSLGGTAGIAACADPRFTFAKLIVSDPACQRLAPWKQHVNIPFVCINSEEFMRSKELAEMMDIWHSAHSNRLMFSISGSNHPSFSDVFLILPGVVNTSVGLRASPTLIISHYVHVTERALAGQYEVLANEFPLAPPVDIEKKTTIFGPGGRVQRHVYVQA